MLHKLMIKTHLDTGLKYLCYTRTEGLHFENYPGSGKVWRRHLKKHGKNIITEVIFKTDDLSEFKVKAKEISELYDVVNSHEWANLKPEEGDGGSTTHGRKWAHNGSEQVYLKKGESLPEGFQYGRIKCVFANPEKQREFSSKVDHKKRGKALKKVWEEGKFKRDHSKCGKKGDDNPAKRPEVVEKIRQAAIADGKNRSERMKRIWENRRGQSRDQLP